MFPPVQRTRVIYGQIGQSLDNNRLHGAECVDMSTSKVTLADVARLASTSHATASRTMNGRPGVRPEVRDAVLRAADELGYRPVRHTRVLSSDSSHLVGFVIGDGTAIVTSAMFSDMSGAILSVLSGAGYHTVLMVSSDLRVPESIIDGIRRTGVDGVIIVGHRGSDQLLKWLDSNGIPTILFGRPETGSTVSYVDVENVEAARVATEHLLDGGRREIGLLAGALDNPWMRDRVRGHSQAMREGSTYHESLVVECELDDAAGAAGVERLLRDHPQLDGLLVSSALMSRGAHRALRVAGRRVPEDVATVTFDDHPLMTFGRVPLSAVRQPFAAIGQALARALIAQLEDGTPRRERLEAELIIRASSAPKPADQAADVTSPVAAAGRTTRKR